MTLNKKISHNEATLLSNIHHSELFLLSLKHDDDQSPFKHRLLTHKNYFIFLYKTETPFQINPTNTHCFNVDFYHRHFYDKRR